MTIWNMPISYPWQILALILILLNPAMAGDINESAPDFTLPGDNGQAVSLSDLHGQVVMINFWASWCGPCRQEMPLLEQIHQRYEPLGFTLLGVNVEENSSDAKAFLKDRPVSFPILFDPDNGVSKLYDVVAMPSTVLIDRQGNVRYLHHGFKPGYENDYQDQVRALVREQS
ncbi:MAG: TlpA family protein disulfide reductase [Gammaproteobacteria bacterium]|nr:TlpA family protein disulfide reductase [Gammaproteobacteria bacterium]